MKIQELNSYMVVFNRGRVLLLKRGDFWEFPGGGVEWGEDPLKAAIRETKEETGLDTYNVKYVTVTSATYEKDGNQKHSVYIVYKGETDSETVNLSGEHREYRWLNMLEAKYLKFGLNAEGILDCISE
ncbi:NUDIX hydrolase [Candidatus Micrarchaeota archaeon]|nr:NUDIX hydrolase [Candidatus Micrarchaeota archaeon]